MQKLVIIYSKILWSKLDNHNYKNKFWLSIIKTWICRLTFLFHAFYHDYKGLILFPSHFLPRCWVISLSSSPPPLHISALYYTAAKDLRVDNATLTPSFLNYNSWGELLACFSRPPNNFLQGFLFFYLLRPMAVRPPLSSLSQTQCKTVQGLQTQISCWKVTFKFI